MSLQQPSKKLKSVIFLLVAIGVFINCAIAEICFCGEACSHVFQSAANNNERFPFHSHCTGADCKSCNFEDGQMLKARNASQKTPAFNILYTHILISSLSTDLLKDHLSNDVTYFIYIEKKILLTPIFLKNQSFLC